MDIREIEELIDIVRTSGVTELTVEREGSKVRVRKQLHNGGAAAKPATSLPEAREPAAEPKPTPGMTPESFHVTAPMVGIFHGAEGLGGVGTRVTNGQVVGSIESMKLMNDIVSEEDGIIAEVLVEDGMPVEYGQELFRIEPSSKGVEDADAAK